MRKPGVCLIFGKPTTGKTGRMLYELDGEPRVVLVDSKCDELARLPGTVYPVEQCEFDLQRGWAHLWPEYTSARDGGWVTSEVPDYFREQGGGDFRCVVHCRAYHRENLELLCYLLARVRNLVLAVDELSLFVSGDIKNLPAVTAVVTSGTHDGIRFMGTSQRPALVSTTVRAAANRMLFYRLTLEHDLDACRSYLGDEFTAKLETLPDFSCVEWTDFGVPFVDQDTARLVREVVDPQL